jgi:uncharacterized protein
VDLGIPASTTGVSGPAVLRATVYRADNRIEIQGTLHATVGLTCDRCLEPVSRDLRIPIRLYADRKESRDRRNAQELREQDLGIVYHDGQSVALAEELRQELLVDIPWHVLCREDCRGLCSSCGANRNVSPCGCAPHAGKAAQETD